MEAREGLCVCLPPSLGSSSSHPPPPTALPSSGGMGRGSEGARKAPARPGPPAPPVPPTLRCGDAQPLRSPGDQGPRLQGGELDQKVDLTRSELGWPGSRPASAPPPGSSQSPGRTGLLFSETRPSLLSIRPSQGSTHACTPFP